MPHLKTAKPGSAGIDINYPLNLANIKALLAHEYSFVIRYVGRQMISGRDLCAGEANMILDNGLGLMVVQHVESETAWIPAAQKGRTYGVNGARFMEACKLPYGTMLWLDLEGVDPNVPQPIVADYCNEWHSGLAGAGYLPGNYVGWNCGLSSFNLYHKLRFTHYWGAYNLNSDEEPEIRGVQMRQYVARPSDLIPGLPQFDIDIVRQDKLGGLPVILTNA